MMWKILTAQVREEIYYLLIICGLFLEEQKRCHKGTRRTGYLLTHPQGEQNAMKNVGMMCINYKKANNMVPQSWMINCLKMYKISNKVIKFITEAMKKWTVELIA